MRAFSKQEMAGQLNHDYVSLTLHPHAPVFASFTKTSFLHVVSTAVWDNKNKKVLIASRWHKFDDRHGAFGKKLQLSGAVICCPEISACGIVSRWVTYNFVCCIAAVIAASSAAQLALTLC
ncbi:MAG: hypothetical protein HC767_09800 [Akkermansiaceae bacterium]|nr:hypothetical protein [Akkermansiaceae bacterium]